MTNLMDTTSPCKCQECEKMYIDPEANIKLNVSTEGMSKLVKNIYEENGEKEEMWDCPNCGHGAFLVNLNEKLEEV